MNDRLELEESGLEHRVDDDEVEVLVLRDLMTRGERVRLLVAVAVPEPDSAWLMLAGLGGLGLLRRARAG